MKYTIHNAENGEISQHEFTIEEETAIVADNRLRAWNDLRSVRDGLLLASDWTVLADTPTNTAAWKAYRQQLRDLPANTADPLNVVWPTPPA